MTDQTNTTPMVTNTESSDHSAGGRTDELNNVTFPDYGGIDVFRSFLLRQPIRDGETTAVRELLTEWTAETTEGDVQTLLPITGVTLTTLFLDDGDFNWQPSNRDISDSSGVDENGDALVWYIETVPDKAEGWRHVDESVRSASPLFDVGLGEFLTGESTLHADGHDGHRYVTHVTLPDRQEQYVDTVGSSLVAPVAGEELPIPVALKTITLRPGLPSHIVARALDAVNWLKSFEFVQSWVRDRTETIEEEAVYTESLLLESVGNRQVLHYYMETEDMEQLYDAYENSNDWEVRFSDWVFRRVFADPSQFLERPLESDCEVLIHAVDPERP